MTSSKHILTFTLSIAAALALAGILWIGHQEQRRAALEGDIAAKQTELAVLDHSRATAIGVNLKVNQLRVAVAGFESRLTPPGEMDKVLENIWRLTRVNSLQTKTIKTPGIQHIGGYREQDMEVSLVGDFNGFYQFLLQLEEGKHLVRIRRIHLSKGERRRNAGGFDVERLFRVGGRSDMTVR